MKSLRIYISLILLTALSGYIAPKELMHEFVSHHDTEDVACTDTCAHHFSEQHQHCDALQLTTPPFHQPFNNFSFAADKLLCVLSAESKSSYHFASSPFLFFRGPPSLI